MGKLDSHTLAFLDVETTGLSPWFGDRICEIAVVRCQGEKIVDTFDTLVNPERPISPGASRVNGLSDEDVSDAPPFPEIASKVNPLLKGAIIVCHNVPFDLGFLSSEFHRCGEEFLPVETIDTLSLAREFFDFDSNSLQSIAEYLMLETPNAHRALGDALTTRDVLQYFLIKLRKTPFDELLETYYPPATAPKNLNLPPLIEEALTSKKRLFIRYVDRKGDETQRWITPKQILALNDYIYVLAHCHLREEERYFRLDRIAEMKHEKEKPT
jgi:DNA polymerase III subunit epsilon